MSPPPGAGSGLERDSRQAQAPQRGAAAGTLGAVEHGLPLGTPIVALTTTPVSWFPAGQMSEQARAAHEVALGDALYRQAKFAPAYEHYQQAIRLRPSDADYHYKLACAAWRGGHWTEARDAFLESLRLNPGSARSHDALGQWYLEDGSLDLALSHSRRARELDPRDPDFIVSHGFILHTQGRLAEAWTTIEPLVERQYESGRLALLFSRLAPRINEAPRALAFTEKLLASPAMPSAEHLGLRVAASVLLDHLGRYDDAFEQSRVVKEMTRPPHNPADLSRLIDRRIEFFTPRKMHDLPRASHGSRRPVFIVGMPRSGTSLVEQILASHPRVYGAGELGEMSRIANGTFAADWTDGEAYPENLDSISLRRANRMAAQYLDAISRRNAAARYVTDKMPLNFVYLGLIQVLFPDCHVIHCTRNPLDTCLSCYMTNFAAGYEFTHDLRHLGTFYRDYRRVMRHWRDVINLPILEVNYEQVVADLPGQTRQLLEFLDLPWDDCCLDFHKNPRPVSTASTDQVRQPVYASSVGRWKHYDKHLSPLIDALGDAVS